MNLIYDEPSYQAALKELESLRGAPPDSPKGDRLDELLDLVEAYEREHLPVNPSDPAA